MNIGMWIGLGLFVIAIAACVRIAFHRDSLCESKLMDMLGWSLFFALGVIGILTLAISAAVAYAAPAPAVKSAGPFVGCPARGDSAELRIQRLDLLKNRATAPQTINAAVTLTAMLAPGADTQRWSNDDGARITGYVVEVKPGGLESVNCHAHDLPDRDTHIELALKPDAKGPQAVVVEVTPYWRAREKAAGKNWSTHALRQQLLGHRVQITGWLFLDAEHVNAAENTRPGEPRDWRGTAWEIHPVTGIKVLSGSGGSR